MNNKTIVAFAGKKQSGKTTCAKYLTHKARKTKHWGRIYSFAEPLKRMCIRYFGLTYKQCYGTDKQKNSYTNIKWGDMPGVGPDYEGFDYQMTAREVVQYVGTEIFRKINDKAWVDDIIINIRDHLDKYAFIDDCRMLNEIEAIQDHDGIIIKLTRNPCATDKHESETNLDTIDDSMYDIILDNANMTIPEQEAELDKIWESLE